MLMSYPGSDRRDKRETVCTGKKRSTWGAFFLFSHATASILSSEASCVLLCWLRAVVIGP